MTFDPSAQYLYIAHRSARTIAGVTVDANTGSLSTIPGMPIIVTGDIRRMVVSRIP